MCRHMEMRSIGAFEAMKSDGGDEEDWRDNSSEPDAETQDDE